jgi:ribosome maturation factor RimP
MDPAVRRERVRDVVEPVVAAAGYDLEDLALSRAGRRYLVRVVVDADGGVSLDDIADVARAVSAALDAAEESAGELIDGEYALEVGSPGVDRPLTLPRHWRRNVGRLVRVQARPESGDRQLTGRVLAADDAGVALDVSGERWDLAYDRLGPGHVQIEFSRLDEVADADTDMRDEELEEER